MDRQPRKGDHLYYTGPYDVSIVEGYQPGVVVRVSRAKELVTVRLDGPDDLYADWQFDEVELVGTPPPPGSNERVDTMAELRAEWDEVASIVEEVLGRDLRNPV